MLDNQSLLHELACPKSPAGLKLKIEIDWYYSDYAEDITEGPRRGTLNPLRELG
jgi:hypothetical protein